MSPSSPRPDVRIHDLRHTFGSAGVNDGMSLPIVGKLLSHTRPETTARYAHTTRYAHLGDTPLPRLAAERISDTIGRAIVNGRRNGSDWSISDTFMPISVVSLPFGSDTSTVPMRPCRRAGVRMKPSACLILEPPPAVERWQRACQQFCLEHKHSVDEQPTHRLKAAENLLGLA